MTPDVKDILEKLETGAPFASVDMSVIRTKVMDHPVSFCVNKRRDPIQRCHRGGTFYEIEELTKLMRIFPKDGIFVDIGGNVGNHSLFAATFLKPSKVIPFEPNPLAYHLLIQNVLVNGHHDLFDLSNLGVGLSDSHSGGFAMQAREKNLGAAKMLQGEGELEVFRGDALLKDVTPALIKIDVEGMEIAVLNGLSGLFERCKPLIFIEVDDENETAFLQWVEANDYETIDIHQRYKSNKNYTLADKKSAARLRKKLKDD